MNNCSQVFDSKDLHCHIYSYLFEFQIIYRCNRVSKLWHKRAHDPASFVSIETDCFWLRSRWNRIYNGYNPILKAITYNPKNIFSQNIENNVRQFFDFPLCRILPVPSIERFQNVRELTWYTAEGGKIEIEKFTHIMNQFKNFTKIEVLTIITTGLILEPSTSALIVQANKSTYGDGYHLDHQNNIKLLKPFAEQIITTSNKLKELRINGSYSRKYRNYISDEDDKWQCSYDTPTIAIVLKSNFSNLEKLKLCHLRFNNDMVFPQCKTKISELSLSSLMITTVFFKSLFHVINKGNLKRLLLQVIRWDRQLTVLQSEEHQIADLIASKLSHGCRLDLHFWDNICKFLLQQISANATCGSIVKRLRLSRIPSESFTVNFEYRFPTLEELSMPVPEFLFDTTQRLRNFCYLFGVICNSTTAADYNTDTDANDDVDDNTNTIGIQDEATMMRVNTFKQFGSNLQVIKMHALASESTKPVLPTLIDILTTSVQFYKLKNFEIIYGTWTDLVLFDDLVQLLTKLDKFTNKVERYNDSMLLTVYIRGVETQSLQSAMEFESTSGCSGIHMIFTLLKHWYVQSLISFEWIFYKQNMPQFQQMRNIFSKKKYFGEWICGADMEPSIKNVITDKRSKNNLCCSDTPLCAVMADVWCLQEDRFDNDEFYTYMLRSSEKTHALFVQNSKAQNVDE